MIGSIRAVLALLVMIVATLVLAPLQVLVLWTGIGRAATLPRLWHRVLARALGLRVNVVGEMGSERPLLIVSNHISWTDIMVLGGLAEMTFIAKADLAGWPVLGALSRLQRTVFIDRDRRRRSGEQAGEIAGRMAANDAVVLFPEGSTGDGNRLLPFKSTLFGAARLALADGASTAYVQPVSIAYTRLHGMPMGRQHRPLAAWIGDSDLVPHLIGLLREGAVDVEVEFGRPVAFTRASDRKAVAREVEAAVRIMLARALRTRQRAD